MGWMKQKCERRTGRRARKAYGRWRLGPLTLTSLGEAGLGRPRPAKPCPGRVAGALQRYDSRCLPLSVMRALHLSVSLALWDEQSKSHQSRKGLRDYLFLASLCPAARQRYTPNISVTGVAASLQQHCSSMPTMPQCQPQWPLAVFPQSSEQRLRSPSVDLSSMLDGCHRRLNGFSI
jgi:hypothetical protein